MAKTFVQQGDVLDYKPTAAKSTGQVVVIGVRIGICLADIAANATGALAVKGVFNVPMLSTDTAAQGALLYWDAVNNRLTVTASGNTLAGYAAAPSAAGMATVWLHLNA